jgi:hypothetical protein
VSASRVSSTVGQHSRNHVIGEHMQRHPDSDLVGVARGAARFRRALRMPSSQSTASRRLRIREGVAVFLVAPIQAGKVLLDNDLE